MPLAREIYQEGIRIPPILLVRGGKFDRPLLELILANVRTPEEREGDLLAQCMAIRRGEQRLLELVAKHGLPTVRRNMTALQDYSERMMRAAIRRLPPGTYRFEDVLDNDGISRASGEDRGRGHHPRRPRHHRLHRIGSASRRLGERQLRGRGLGDDVRVPLPGARGHPVHRRPDAAARSDRAGWHRW